VRDRTNLQDFLFEVNGAYIKRDAAKNFDMVDMVFVAGDANMRPWSKNASKIMALIKMCIRVRKIMFACSFAMHALVFLAATNFEKNYEVING
jgi:hypothetical protein